MGKRNTTHSVVNGERNMGIVTESWEGIWTGALLPRERKRKGRYISVTPVLRAIVVALGKFGVVPRPFVDIFLEGATRTGGPGPTRQFDPVPLRPESTHELAGHNSSLDGRPVVRSDSTGTHPHVGAEIRRPHRKSDENASRDSDGSPGSSHSSNRCVGFLRPGSG